MRKGGETPFNLLKEVDFLKKFLVILMALIMSALMMNPAFAATDIRTGTPSESSQATYTAVQGSVSEITGDITPDVTTDDVINKLEHKGNDIVRILQIVGQYVCIGAFIICCFLVIVGLMGNKRLLTGALFGLIFSGVAVVGILYSRDILNFVASWLAS